MSEPGKPTHQLHSYATILQKYVLEENKCCLDDVIFYLNIDITFIKWRAGESSGGGRVTPKAKGTGGHHGYWQSGPGVFPKDPGQQRPGQGETPSNLRGGPSRRGRRASEQGGGAQAAEGVDKVGESSAVQDHLVNHHAGRLHRICFLVQAVYDALPSPANLHVWGKSEIPSCPLL